MREWENWTGRIEKDVSAEIMSYAPLLVKKGIIDRADKYHVMRWCVKEMCRILHQKVEKAQQHSTLKPESKANVDTTDDSAP